MDFKYVKGGVNIKSTQMNLSGEIGIDINGFEFADELYALDSQGVRQCTIVINSEGGLVNQADEIITAMRRTTMRVDTEISGLAASAAAIIAMCGYKVSMTDSSRFMIHNVQTEGEVHDEVMDLFNRTIAIPFSNKTGKSVDDVRGMMDVTSWLDASQAKANRFIDLIVPTNRKTLVPENISAKELVAFYNKLNNDTEEMKDLKGLLNDLKTLIDTGKIKNADAVPAEAAPAESPQDEKSEDDALKQLLQMVQDLAQRVQAMEEAAAKDAASSAENAAPVPPAADPKKEADDKEKEDMKNTITNMTKAIENLRAVVNGDNVKPGSETPKLTFDNTTVKGRILNKMDLLK